MNLFLLTLFATVGAVNILQHAAIAYTGEALPPYTYEHASFYLLYGLLAIAVVCVVMILSANVAESIKISRLWYSQVSGYGVRRHRRVYCPEVSDDDTQDGDK